MKISKIFILGLGFISVFSPKAEAALKIKASLSKKSVKQGEPVTLNYSLLSSSNRRLAADVISLKRYSNPTCSTFVEDVSSTSSMNGLSGSKEFSIAAPGVVYLKAVKDGYNDSSCLALNVLNSGAQFEKLVVKRDSEFDNRVPFRLEWKSNSDVLSAGATEKVKISIYSDSSCQTKVPRVRELTVAPKDGQANFSLMQPSADRFAKAVSSNGISSSCFIVPKDFVSGLEHETSALDASYVANGVVQWEDFKANQELHKNKVVEVDQADFASGTLRIKKPLKLKFKENVAFNPNRPEPLPNGKIDPNRSMDWFPLGPVAQPEYYEPSVARAYGLGFFAAIAVETEGVIVDLNGQTLSMHPEFAVMQQFYSHIELASQPFAPANGPFNFGDDLTAARKVWIKNGTLSNSTHQAIHGNNNTDVRISSVIIDNFSVAGISLNGSERVSIKGSTISGGRPTKLLGAFNSIRLDSKLVQGYKAAKGGVISSELQAAHDAAKLAVEKVFNDIMSPTGTGSVREYDPNDPTTLAAKDVAVIKNYSDLPDAISYGIVINPAGNATGKFMEQRERNQFGVLSRKPAKIFIGSGTTVTNVKSAVREVMAMSPAIDASQEFTLADGTAGYNVNAQMRGATGAVLDHERVFDLSGGIANPHFGKYVGTVISDLQIELAAAQNAEPSAALKARLGQINIEPAFIEMKRGTSVGQKLRFIPIGLAEPLAAEAEGDRVWLLVDSTVNSDPTHTPFGEPVSSSIIPGDTRGLGELEFVALANGDIQHHVLKGNFGIRIEGATGVTMDGVTVSAVENHGTLGYQYTNFAMGQPIGWSTDATGGHGSQGSKMTGYFGNHARGISIAACTDVKLLGTAVNSTVSHTGPAFGIDIKNDTQGLTLSNVSVSSVHAGSLLLSSEVAGLAGTDKNPNWEPVAVGYQRDESSGAELGSVTVNDLLVGQFGQ